MDFDAALVLRNDFFADSQPQTDTFIVTTRRLLLQFAVPFEKFVEVLAINAFTRVSNVDDHRFFNVIVRSAYLDKTLGSEFKRVFDQVDQYLL